MSEAWIEEMITYYDDGQVVSNGTGVSIAEYLNKIEAERGQIEDIIIVVINPRASMQSFIVLTKVDED